VNCALAVVPDADPVAIEALIRTDGEVAKVIVPSIPDEDITPLATVDPIGSISTVEDVATLLTVNPIRPAATVHDIVVVTREDRVVAPERGDPVITTTRADDVCTHGAAQVVVPGRALDGALGLVAAAASATTGVLPDVLPPRMAGRYESTNGPQDHQRHDGSLPKSARHLPSSVCRTPIEALSVRATTP
jgi:hypothetical protein